MNQQVLIPEPISKNVFEQYIRLIEKIKYDIKDSNLKIENQTACID